jgi:Beta-glucan synthesis-associated protein SKN1/KRE6/Sbg1
MVVHLTPAMILIGKQSIFGIGSLVIKSGTIPDRSIPPMVAFISGLIMLLQTGCLIALACSRVGISFASPAVTSRSLLPYPDPTLRLEDMWVLNLTFRLSYSHHLSVSGLEFGRWAISPDRDTVQRPMACGPTRKCSCVLHAGSLTVTWFPRYDACDVGTLPNQTWVNGTGPAAALNSTASKAKYNYSLSYLSGQRLSYAISVRLAVLQLNPFFFCFPSSSACTCPGEDHPGPSPNTGRGAPEIDVFEAEHNKQGSGGVISQSAQFAPFTSDYTFLNDTDDEWKVYNPSISHANDYKYVLHSQIQLYH